MIRRRRRPRPSPQRCGDRHGMGRVNPTGNVIRFQSRPGTVTQPGGNGIDTDVDRTDQPNSLLTVTGIRTGAEIGSDTTPLVSGATVIAGSLRHPDHQPGRLIHLRCRQPKCNCQAWAPGPRSPTPSPTGSPTPPANRPDRPRRTQHHRAWRQRPARGQRCIRDSGRSGRGRQCNAGTNPTGDATANDFDPDGNPISVIAFRTGTEAGTGSAGTIGSSLQGTYGSLTLSANGTYTYIVDNDNAAVQALRISGQTLSETFTYQIADNATPTPETDLGQIIVTIEGATTTRSARTTPRPLSSPAASTMRLPAPTRPATC